MKPKSFLLLCVLAAVGIGVLVVSLPPSGPGAQPVTAARPASAVEANRKAAGPAPAAVSRPVAAAPQASDAFADFSRWTTQFTNGTASLADGQRAAWRRREALLELIQTDPQRALAAAIPFELRQQLPPEVARHLEDQVDGRGDLLVLAATDFEHGRTTISRNVTIGERRFDAFVFGRRTRQISQENIPLHGIALDGKLALATETFRPLSLAEAMAMDPTVRAPDVICSVSGQSADRRAQHTYAASGRGVKHFCGVNHLAAANGQAAYAESGGTSAGSRPVFPTATDDAWTHGRKSVLYIRVNFPDDLTEPISETAAYNAMNGVSTYYTENSFNLASLTTTVTPVITMPQTKAYYSGGAGLLLDDARTWAKKAGYVTANYDRDIVALTGVPGYDWGGLGAVGGKGTWLQSMGVGVTAHELGHNYGLLHANFWDTTANFSSSGAGVNLEYGNSFDTMGSGGVALFNAVHKNILDWLKADAVQTITTNGVYRIYPFDVAASSVVAGRSYAAAFRKDALRDYWVEFRSRNTSNPWQQNGLLLNWTPWDESNGGAQLIDTTPGSPNSSDDTSRTDSAVTIGRTYSDLAAGVHITPLRRGASGVDPWIDYRVNLGTFPGNQPPTLAVEVDQPLPITNSLVHFHATARDLDGDELAYAWTFDDLTFSTNNLPWISQTFSDAADHVVRCVVSDMKGGRASANVLVSRGTATGFRVTGRVTDANGAPLENVLVSNGQIKAASFVGGWTDSDGRYLLVNVTNINNLQAFADGWSFTGNFSNPVQATSDLAGLNFTGVSLPTVNVVANTNTIAEGATNLSTFTITRTGDTSADLVVRMVPLATASTATYGADYTLDPDIGATNTTITIPAGTNRITFTNLIVDDNLIEGPETITFTLLADKDPANQTYVLAAPAEAIVTIADNDAVVRPAVSVKTSTPVISENGMSVGQFIFTRAGNPGGDLFVNYTVSGTATADADYVALTGVVLIPAGQSSATVALKVIDDKNLEPDETVTVTLAANAAYSSGSPSAATVKIADDDFMTVTVVATGNATEPSDAGAFTFKRDGDLTEALVVNYTMSGTASNGVDYATLPGTVTIPAGSPTTSISVDPIDDALLEGDETVILTLANTVNYDVGVPGSAKVILYDDEKPTVSVAADIKSVSERGDTNGTFIVSRDTTAGDLTVYLAISGTATPGADYVPLDNPVVIPDGQSSVTVEVIPFHDLIYESDETVILTLPTNAAYNVSSGNSATVTITDIDATQIPAVGFCFATSAVPENESPGIAVGLSHASTTPVYVNYRVLGATAASNRWTLAQGTLMISNSLVGFVPLKIVNDATVQPPQNIRVLLYNPTNATLDAIKIHTYTILDDDTCAVSVAATASSASETGPVAGNFRISRSGSTVAAQPVNFQITGSASAPSDYAPLGTSTVIPAGASFVDLPVVPSDDNTMEFSQNVVLTLISATNASIASPNIATVTIGDNDTNTLPVVAVTSTNRPFAYEGGGNGEFVFTRSGPVTNALTVNYTIGGTAANTTDYSTIASAITFGVGQSNLVVGITAVDDAAIEGDETVVLTLIQATNYRCAYPAFAQVTIQDNDQRVWLDASDFIASKYSTVVGGDPGEFTFTRFGTTNTPVTLTYTITGTASNGVDYATITNSIVIPAGQLTTTLPILPRHSGLVVGPVTVKLTLLANPAFTLGTPTSGTVTIYDDMPGVSIYTVVTNVLEGSGASGVFRLVRSGDPQYDFTALLNVGGTATYGVDYPPFATNVFFSCGVTSIDLFVTPTNEVVQEDTETVAVTFFTNAAYTVLPPTNALVNILDAGTNATPQVRIVSPVSPVVFMDGATGGLILNATVSDDSTNLTFAWTNLSGPAEVVFGDPTVTNTSVLFTNGGIYRLRLTADDGQLQGRADLIVFVSDRFLPATNILRWTLDDGVGTNVLDTAVSTNGRNGTLSGAPGWLTNGIVGGALSLLNSNDSIRQTSGSNTLNGLTACSVMLWLKPTTNATQGILTGDDASTNATFGFGTRTFASCGNATNVFEATLATAQGSLRRISASAPLNPGGWRHVALTWTNGAAPQLYFNGQPDQPEKGFAGISGGLTNCPQFVVGKGGLGSPASWLGGVDDVRVFDRALSAVEILALGTGPQTNHAPNVNAGPDVSVQIGVPITLVGAVTDDGRPNPPALLTNLWVFLGTNNITITNPASLTNTLVFSQPGNYTFRLISSDGDAAVFDDVVVTVLEPISISVYPWLWDAYELGPVPAEFILVRSGDTNEVNVNLVFSGTATAGLDYLAVTNVFNLPAGSNTLTIPIVPILDYRIEGDETVTVTVQTNAAYFVAGTPASVTIHDSPYGLWSIQKFTLEELTFPNISGASADFDADGVVNFAEYAFNRDPKLADGNPPYRWGFETNTADSQLHFTLTWTRRLPPRDVEYGVFVSTNLLDWQTGTNYVEEFSRNYDANGFTETVKTRAVVPFTGTNAPSTNALFMNLRVWLQQVPP